MGNVDRAWLACAVSLFFCSRLAVEATSPPSIQWVYGFNNSNCEAHPHKVVQTRDGGYFMVGDSVCWDGSSTAKRMIFVVKADRNGKMQWSSRHGDVHYNYGKGGIELNDGTFLVVGAISKLGNAYYTEHRALIRLSADGKTLRTTIMANAGERQGLLDGFMCVDQEASGDVVLTGFEGGNETYPDEPMFLIYGGHAFLMKLRFAALDADPVVVYQVPLVGDGFKALQGMRLGLDHVNNRIAVTSLAVSNKDPDVPQMSLFSFEPSSGDLVWSRFLPANNELASGVMSHPYAFAVASDGSGYVVAGHAFPCFDEIKCQPSGRLVKVGVDGTLEWDSRFRNNKTYYNTECYGASAAADGGFAVACGTGVEPEDHPDAPAHDKQWESLVFKADAKGATEWQHLYTTNEHGVGNAAEDVFMTRDGGYALALDSSFGKQGTGGNFGLMRLAPDTMDVATVSV